MTVLSTATYPATFKPLYAYQSSQSYKTFSSEYENGAEQRNQTQRFSKRSFTLNYKMLSATNRNTLVDFFRLRRGQLESFYFVDFAVRKWTDNFCGYGGALPLTVCLQSDGGVFTDYTTPSQDTTASDVIPFPAGLVTNDAVYFGSHSPFDSLSIVIGTAGVGKGGGTDWQVAWEYWNGSTWSAVSNLSDGSTNGFHHAAGTVAVTWDMPTDWVDYTVSSNKAYFVRARISNNPGLAITTAPLITSVTCNSHVYDLGIKTSSDVAIYVDSVLKTLTTDYVIVSGGGKAGCDRVSFVANQTTGTIITCDGTGYLTIPAKFDSDELKESMATSITFSVETGVTEIL